MKILFIGDIHAKCESYKAIIKNNTFDLSIQIGDFGFKAHMDWLEKHNIDPKKNKILFGNHDYYPYLNKPFSLGNFKYFPDIDLFCIRGANSIDKQYRYIGQDWFREEELNFKESLDCIELYSKSKPNVVVSHDCPQIVKETVFNYYDHTPTTSLLQACFEIHKPKIWIFGHHHTSLNKIILDTNFICLDELETYFLDL